MPRLRQVPRRDVDDPIVTLDVRPRLRQGRRPARERHRHRLRGRLVDRLRARARHHGARRAGLRALPQPRPQARRSASRAGPDPGRLERRIDVRLLAALQGAAGPRDGRRQDRRGAVVAGVAAVLRRRAGRAGLRRHASCSTADACSDDLFAALKAAPLRRGDPRAHLRHGDVPDARQRSPGRCGSSGTTSTTRSTRSRTPRTSTPRSTYGWARPATRSGCCATRAASRFSVSSRRRSFERTTVQCCNGSRCNGSRLQPFEGATIAAKLVAWPGVIQRVKMAARTRSCCSVPARPSGPTTLKPTPA